MLWNVFQCEGKRLKVYHRMISYQYWVWNFWIFLVRSLFKNPPSKTATWPKNVSAFSWLVSDQYRLRIRIFKHDQRRFSALNSCMCVKLSLCVCVCLCGEKLWCGWRTARHKVLCIFGSGENICTESNFHTHICVPSSCLILPVTMSLCCTKTKFTQQCALNVSAKSWWIT